MNIQAPLREEWGHGLQRYPLWVGDEIAVDSDIPGVQHRGLIYAIPSNPAYPVQVIHFNKGTHAVIDTLADFARGKNVRLLRRPQSVEHASIIIQRANQVFVSGEQYHWFSANCEHFTEYCYTGEAKSPTVAAGLVMGGALLFAVLDSVQSSSTS
jgi:hypothetical protein